MSIPVVQFQYKNKHRNCSAIREYSIGYTRLDIAFQNFIIKAGLNRIWNSKPEKLAQQNANFDR